MEQPPEYVAQGSTTFVYFGKQSMASNRVQVPRSISLAVLLLLVTFNVVLLITLFFIDEQVTAV